MPKKLAITVSGAVSLGSYEAGVMYEVTRAIGQHNHASENKDNQIIIDVLTGASAGGMTATIVAQKLMFEAGALDGAYTNSLYGPWVTDVDIQGLLEEFQGDSDTKSILSSKFVEQISRRYITARYLSHADPPRHKHPAAADKIWLGLALANLNGVNYGLNIQSGGKFIYSRFEDELTVLIENQAGDDSLDFWEALRNAAVSCGAFPFAFRPVEVIRHRFEYDLPNLVSTILPTQNFCYTDGGTFHNEPLGMAKNLVDKLDPTHVETADRCYLFVSPGGKKSVASSQLNADNADFIPFTKQIVAAIFNQARFQDWVMAEKVNNQVELFNKRASGLVELLKGDSTDIMNRARALQSTSDSILPELFKEISSQAGKPPADLVNEARARLKKQFKVEYDSLPSATRNTSIDSILLLETAANLGERDEMNILDITADDSELAGADLFAFCGFFDFKYRKHDYDVGRKKAQEFLTETKCPLGIDKNIYKPELIDPIDNRLDNLKLENMEEGVREKVYDRFKCRILDTLQKTGLNWAERTAVFDFVIGPKLKKILKL